ncbi:S9 family peptidase [Paraliomyxa miuraensis]|uniref:S9 family peptidase n=1 Tax=Paraliomyxa miuraensis TaxID=376150 RepID=UPI00225AFDF2|nr:S9 family peptidase [Paraliomyxa miuraensis]MCX4243067.1 S9 family peptidase [Paraliomyxa miuraensis]
MRALACVGLLMVFVASGCVAKTAAPPEASASPVAGAGEPAEDAVAEAQSELIPRAVIFGNPERTAVQVSPDGKWISWLAPRDGVLNVWVAPAGDLAKGRPVTAAKTRPITLMEWTFDGKHLVYEQDEDGDENFHWYRVAVETGEVVDLTPIDGVRAQGPWLSSRKPDTMLVGLNDRDPGVFDLHAIDLATGQRRLVARNDRKFTGWIVDHDLEVRLAQTMTETGALVWMVKRGNGWRHYDEIPAEDTGSTGMLGFDATGRSYYMFDSRGRDTAALVLVDAKTKTKRLVHADERADLEPWLHPWFGLGPRVLVHPTEATVQAIVVDREEPRWVVLDPRVAEDFDALAGLDSGFPYVTSRTLDDQTWIVGFESDVRSDRFYRWDRRTQEGEFLFAERPALDRHALVPMHAVTIDARDGLPLVSYLSLPEHADPDGDGKPERRTPMVLLVHGGPWVRDRWRFYDLHQLLANRGYAVLSVNYRGSTGFGKAFTNAGNGQWGKEMHDDLLDAVAWAVEHGIAEKDRVCIGGMSYGGYATLVGLTLTPDAFACGVDIVGPSSLVTLFEQLPPYWRPGMSMFYERVGDPRTPEGKQALLEVSPLTHAARITKPLLIGQGANDPRVRKSESDQIVAAMKANGIPVGYVVFPDEGHGFERPENNQAFFAIAEAFLSVHLGGGYQPIDEAELAASSMVIEAGRRWLPGLPAEGGGRE